MFSWVVVPIVSAAIPLAFAWWANRGWTIRHAIVWTWLAWAAWCLLAWFQSEVAAYAALTFTAAAFIAVLGARRPGVVAWNFVVAAFLIVMWIGWAEGLVRGSGLQLGNVRLAFVGGLLVSGVLEYVGTRFSPAAIMLAIACGWLLYSIFPGNVIHRGPVLVAAAVPWLALLIASRKPAGPNGEWLDFRDRYGFFWAHLTREQFNAAAKNNGWDTRLQWQGLTLHESDEPRAALIALLKRFRTP